MTTFDTAWVEILPKFDRFRPELIRGVDKGLKGIGPRADRAGQQIGRQTGKQAGTHFGISFGQNFDFSIRRSIGPKASKAGSQVGKKAGKQAGTDFGDMFQRTIGASVARTMIKLSAVVATTGFAGGALSAATAGLVAFTAAVAPAAGAAAVLPATYLAIGQAAGVAKLATFGLGEALSSTGKEGDAAMAALAPSARAFVREIKEVEPRFNRIRKAIQGEAFAGLSRQVQPLARIYLPMLRSEGIKAAGVFNQMGERAAFMLRSPLWRRDLAAVIQGNTRSLFLLGRAGFPVLNIFRDLAVTVQPLTQRFVSFLGDATIAMSNFVSRSRGTGQLQAFFQRAGDTAAQLGRILANVAVAGFNFFRVGAFTGRGLLIVLEDAAAKLRAFTESTAGQEKMRIFFEQGKASLREIGLLLRDAKKLFGDTFSGQDLAPFIAQIRTQLLPAIDRLLTSLNTAGALPKLVEAATQFVNVISGAGGALDAFASTLLAIGNAAVWASKNVPGFTLALTALATAAGVNAAVKVLGLSGALKFLVGALRPATVSTNLHTAATKINTAATAVSQSTIGTWIGVKAIEARSWLTSTLAAARHTVAVVANRIATTAATIAAKAFSLATRAMGIAMTIATGPIGMVIVGVAALAAGLIYAYKHSETFKKIVDATFKFIARSGLSMWNDFLKPSFAAIVTALKAIGTAASFLWNKVLKPTFRFIVAAFLSMAQSIIDGAAFAFGWIPKLGDKLRAAQARFSQFRDQVNRSLSGVKDRKVLVGWEIRGTGAQAVAYTKSGGKIFAADGGIVNFANGSERHVAQVARPGAMRVWAEPETGGEAYIPLASSKRQRSTEILGAVASRFGMGLTPMAKGGLLVNAQARGMAQLQGGMASFNRGMGRVAAAIGSKVSAAIEKNVKWGGPALEFAKSQVGKPYVWGGFGPGGYDCCMRSGTRVRTLGGYQNIEDLQPGDQVMSFVDGEPHFNQVNAAWFSKRQETYRVRLRTRAVEASANHPFLRLGFTPEACTEGGNSREGTWATEWVRLDQLRRDDYVVIFSDTDDTRAMEDTQRTVEDVPEDLAWLLGVYVGDGCMNDDSLRICVYGELRERVQDVSARHWGRKGQQHPKAGVIINKASAVRWMRSNGFSGKSHEKRVPDIVWRWSRASQRAFLTGYADADGHRPTREPGSIVYTATSRGLLNDIRELHMILGDQASRVGVGDARLKPVSIRGQVVVNARPTWRFTARPGRPTMSKTSQRHPARPLVDSWSPAFGVQRVLGIESTGEHDTWDIEVEGAHNFVTDGVVVHNSGFMSAILNVIQNRSPYSRRGTTGDFPWSGFARGAGQFMIGSYPGFRASPGHMAGTLAGVNVESRGGEGVVVGSRARGARSSLFGGNVWRLRNFARGGILSGDPAFDYLDPRGLHYLGNNVRGVALRADTGRFIPPGGFGYNGTSRPEWMGFGPPGGSRGDTHIHLYNTGVISDREQAIDWLMDGLSRAQKRGKIRRGVVVGG